MGGALVKGWVAAKPSSALYVIEPHPSAIVQDWAASGAIFLSSEFPASLPSLSAFVLGTKQQVLKAQGSLLKDLGKNGGLVLSIAAGVTTSFLRTHLGGGVALVRAMPSTP